MFFGFYFISNVFSTSNQQFIIFEVLFFPYCSQQVCSQAAGFLGDLTSFLYICYCFVKKIFILKSVYLISWLFLQTFIYLIVNLTLDFKTWSFQTFFKVNHSFKFTSNRNKILILWSLKKTDFDLVLTQLLSL